MVNGVANAWVSAQDVGRALDFYQNTLGFSLVKRDGPRAKAEAMAALEKTEELGDGALL